MVNLFWWSVLVAKNPLNYDTFGDFPSSFSLLLSLSLLLFIGFLHGKFSEKGTLNAIHYRLSRFLGFLGVYHHRFLSDSR